MGMHATCLQRIRMKNSYKYPPRFGTFDLFLSSPLLVVCLVVCQPISMFCQTLLDLSECSRISRSKFNNKFRSCATKWQHWRRTTWTPRHLKNRLRILLAAVSSPPLDPIPHDTDPSLQCIQGASWAEEMEILQPQGDEDLYGSVKLKRPTWVARVMSAMEALLKRSFVSSTKIS